MTPLYSEEDDSPVKLVPYKDPGCVWILNWHKVIFCTRAVQQSCTATATNTRHRKHNYQSLVTKMYPEMLKMKYMSVCLQFEVL